MVGCDEIAAFRWRMNKLTATASFLRRGFGVPDISTDRPIIFARPLLAAVARLAIRIAPTQPSRFAEWRMTRAAGPRKFRPGVRLGVGAAGAQRYRAGQTRSGLC